MKESRIEKRLTGLVHQRGGLCFKFTSPNNAGVPDRIIALPGGRIVFVELKADNGTLDARQRWQIERLRKLGAEVRVLKGMQQVNDFVKEVCPVDISAP